MRASFDESQQRYGSPRDPRRSARAAGAREPEAGHPADAGRRPAGARRASGSRCTTMSDHDQPVAANLLDRQFTAEAPESAVGRRHHRVRHRRERQAVSRRDPRSVLAVHRRLGRQRRQRSASDDQGARDGAEAALPRAPACCITPTRAARTRARTTRRSSTAHGITCSMSRRGNCYDNAVMEASSRRSRASSASASRATATPRWSCSTTSRCSITSGAGTRRSAT